MFDETVATKVAARSLAVVLYRLSDSERHRKAMETAIGALASVPDATAREWLVLLANIATGTLEQAAARAAREPKAVADWVAEQFADMHEDAMRRASGG